MQNTPVKAIVIVLAVIGALALLGVLGMGIACSMMAGGGTMSAMLGSLGEMMAGGILALLLWIAAIGVIIALIVALVRRK